MNGTLYIRGIPRFCVALRLQLQVINAAYDFSMISLPFDLD